MKKCYLHSATILSQGGKDLSNGILEETQRFLKRNTEEINVVVMPDFFLDRLISLKCSIKRFSEALENVARRKGGCIDGIEQMELRGGNAINTTSALAALGVKVVPIACTNMLGLQMIKFFLQPLGVDLSHVKTFKRLSVTTAIELESDNGRVNVMLRDIGALANFGNHQLDNDDFEAIENADYICVFNWAGTRRCGTELAKTVFRHVKMKGEGKTYYDTADPTPNKKRFQSL